MFWMNFGVGTRRQGDGFQVSGGVVGGRTDGIGCFISQFFFVLIYLEGEDSHLPLVSRIQNLCCMYQYLAFLFSLIFNFFLETFPIGPLLLYLRDNKAKRGRERESVERETNGTGKE